MLKLIRTFRNNWPGKLTIRQLRNPMRQVFITARSLWITLPALFFFISPLFFFLHTLFSLPSTLVAIAPAIITACYRRIARIINSSPLVASDLLRYQ